MRSSAPIIIAFFVCLNLVSARDTLSKMRGARALTFENLDFTFLNEEAHKYDLSLSEPELKRAVQINFQFIYLNQLNTNNFLSAPEPQMVLDKVVVLLQLDQRVASLIRRGRQIVSESYPRQERRQIAREIGSTAKQMKELFAKFFIELKKPVYRIRTYQGENTEAQFIHYLIQSDQISRDLRREVQDYFFNSVPGGIQVSRFERSSVMVLCESLLLLSNFIEQSLR